MKLGTLLFSVVIFQTGAFAQAKESHKSAIRYPHESWHARSLPPAGDFVTETVERSFAEDVAKPLELLDLSTVSKISDYKTIQSMFEKTRDARFMDDPDVPNFLRRVTWMYPDDGCYARAALVNQNLESWGQAPLTKLFVFGNLWVKSPNAASGTVPWWYHVANVVTDGKETYILDPAVEPSRPLKLMEWIGRLGGDPFMAATVCNNATYAADTDCYHASITEDDIALDDEVDFLSQERARLQYLGRNEEKELGDSPPWLKRHRPRPHRIHH